MKIKVSLEDNQKYQRALTEVRLRLPRSDWTRLTLDSLSHSLRLAEDQELKDDK